VSEEMQRPFNVFLAKEYEDVGSGAPDIGHLKEIGNRNKAVIFKDLPGHLSVANVTTTTEPSGQSRFTLFKHGTRVLVGSRDKKTGDGTYINALPTLKAGLSEKQSETPIPEESFLKFSMVDYYGCVKLKVTDAMFDMCKPLESMDAAGQATFSHRPFLECKMSNNYLLGNVILLDLLVLNPHDLHPGDENDVSDVLLHSYSQNELENKLKQFFNSDPKVRSVRLKESNLNRL
jgi:hypothetical protein